jgi:hypothetical protein
MNIKLLKDLDFATKINEATAATSAGQDLLNNYKSYLFTNSANCLLVNGFVQEASKYSYDTGLIGILESVNKYINENKIEGVDFEFIKKIDAELNSKIDLLALNVVMLNLSGLYSQNGFFLHNSKSFPTQSTLIHILKNLQMRLSIKRR